MKNAGFIKRLAALLGHRHFPLIAAMLGMLLTAPSMKNSLLMDDYWQWAALSDRCAIKESLPLGDGNPLDLFRFLDGDPEHIRKLMDVGLPWWTWEHVKGAFWRPLTCITHWLDYQLWPEQPALMHAQSILWFGLLIVIIGIFYRRFVAPAWIAGLATLLVAVNETFAMPVGFLANRNALPAVCFGVAALIMHDRWRKNNSTSSMLLACLFLVASLLSKESGVSIFAYLFAYALVLDRAEWKHRLRSLLPYVIVIAVWRMVWSGLGYGVNGVGWYVDPLKQPLQFFMAILERFPILTLGQWTCVPADMNNFMEANRTLIFTAGSFVLLLLLVIFIPLIRRDRLLRFLALGSTLAVLPACTTAPSNRLLCFVTIGASAMTARFIYLVFTKSPIRPASLLWRFTAIFTAVFFVFSHLLAAPFELAVWARHPFGPPDATLRYMVNMDFAPGIENQHLVIVNPGVSLLATYTAVIQDYNNNPVPKIIWSLSSGYPAITLARLDDRTISIRPQGGFLANYIDELFRNPQVPMSFGEKVHLSGMTVEITEMTPDSRPVEATFTFSVPLEDHSLYWICWKDGCFQPFTPPPIGQTVEIPFTK